MERTNLKVKKVKAPSFWKGARNSSAEDDGGLEYISKLTSLRDMLINQEKVCFEKALCRIDHKPLITNNRSFRLRMNGTDDSKHQPPKQRLNMSETVEKFRQLRQQQQQYPLILPLEGKQIFSAQRGNNSRYQTVYTVDRSTDIDSKGVDSVSVLQPLSRVEDILHNDLLHFMETTSRLPRFGTKAQKKHDPPVYNSQQVLPLRPRICAQTGNHQAASLQPIHNFSSITTSQISAYHPTGTKENNCQCHFIGNHLTHNHEQHSNRQPLVSDMDKPDKFYFHDFTDSTRLNDKTERGKRPYKEIGDRGLGQLKTPMFLMTKSGLHFMHQGSSKHFIFEENENHEDGKITFGTKGVITNGFSGVFSSNAVFNTKAVKSDYSRKPQLGLEKSQKPNINHEDFSISEGESDNENKDLIVTRFPTIRLPRNFKRTSTYSKDSTNTFNSSKVSKSDSTWRNIQVDNVRHKTERQQDLHGSELLGHLDPPKGILRSRRRKIRIVIDMPDAAMESPSSQSEFSFADNISDNG